MMLCSVKKQGVAARGVAQHCYYYVGHWLRAGGLNKDGNGVLTNATLNNGMSTIPR